MEKTFGPQFKKILIMDIVAAAILILHCLVFSLIASQGEYLKGYASDLLPDYVSTTIRWGILEVVTIMIVMFRMASMKKDGTLKESDKMVYMFLAGINVFVPIRLLLKQKSILAFLAIAIDHVALYKTVLFITTLAVPILIMLAIAVVVILWLTNNRKTTTE